MLFESFDPLLLPIPLLCEFGQLAVDEVDHALQFAHLSLTLIATLSQSVRGYLGGLIRGLQGISAV